MSESTKTRLWIFALNLAFITATLLVIRINTFEISLAYLGLLAGITAVGLMTNLLGGLAASAVGVCAIILINRFAGIYPRENLILNIASELIVFLLIGPLAGMVSGSIEAIQRQANQWLARAEDQTVHDTAFGTLKPEWSKLRLEEEALRADKFGRPLSVALLQLLPDPKRFPTKPADQRAERMSALLALVRVARLTAQPPAVVSYLGGDRVLMILPEHTEQQARQVVANIQRYGASAVYFPSQNGSQRLSDKSLGKPLNSYGSIYAGVTCMDGIISGEAILEQANAELMSNEANRV